jgi:hypothetical protein
LLRLRQVNRLEREAYVWSMMIETPFIETPFIETPFSAVGNTADSYFTMQKYSVLARVSM